jgi:hypothetical protein
MNNTASRFLLLVEAFAFCAYVGWYIWQLQQSFGLSWIVFPVWLVLSFLVHKDTLKSLGWRADNLASAFKYSAMIFVPCLIGLAIIGTFLGAWHRPFQALLVPRHFFGYMAFCLVQQIGLNSLFTNRLLSAIDSRVQVSVLAGTIFALLHWPNPVLVPVTWLGGFLMSWLFAKERNILSLAIWQGVLGTVVWWAFPVAWHHAMRVGPGFYHFQLR